MPGESVSDSINAAFKELTGLESEDSDDETVSTQEDGTGDDVDSEPEAEAEEFEGEKPEEPDADDEADESALDPPASWTKADKERFGELPRWAQELALDNEKRVRRTLSEKGQELAQERQYYAALNDLMEPERARLRLVGQTEQQYLSSLIEADKLARSNPQAFMQFVSQQLGIPQGQMGTQENGAAPHGAPPDWAQQLAAQNQQIQTAFVQQQQQGIQDELKAFQFETDDSGAPLHPFLEENEFEEAVYPEFVEEMSLQIQSLRGKNPDWGPRKLLNEAYKRTEQIDESAQRVRRQQEAVKQRAAEDKKVAKAKKRATSISGGPGDALSESLEGASAREILESLLPE